MACREPNEGAQARYAAVYESAFKPEIVRATAAEHQKQNPRRFRRGLC